MFEFESEAVLPSRIRSIVTFALLFPFFQMSKFESEVVPPSRVRVMVRFALSPRHRRLPKGPIRVALKAAGVFK